jgi:hypothetical protein
MHPIITLEFTDELGQPKAIEVKSPSFAIGRSPENDLVLGNGNLSRRHALIEFVEGFPYISDLGSQNGTFLNGEPINSSRRLLDGDVINPGGARDLHVRFGAPATVADKRSALNAGATEAASAPAGSVTPTLNTDLPRSASPSFLNVPVVAGAAIGLILLCGVAIALFIATRKDDRRSDRGAERQQQSPYNRHDATVKTPSGVEVGSTTETESNDKGANSEVNNDQVPRAGENQGAAGEVREDAIGRAAQRVMGRISKDSSPYISSQGIKDIAAKVREYHGSASLGARIRAMANKCPDVTALAQTNSLKPALLTYAALAESEGQADPVAVARQMAPKLLTLRATFGSDTSNSSLLLVAAYPYQFNPQLGSQTRTAHPLASKLVELGGRRSMEDTSIARSVWFLREKNGITPEAYDLVIRFLAVGIISQDPHSYGVDADPLFC